MFRIRSKVTCVGLFLFAGCTHLPSGIHRDQPPAVANKEVNEQTLKEIQTEVSLKKDRTDLDNLRNEIEPQKRQSNDEIATLMDYVTKESEEDPSRLRERFQSAQRRKKERVEKLIQEFRDDFSRKESSAREDFVRKLKEEREEVFDKIKQNSKDAKTLRKYEDERRNFLANQESSRQRYFSTEREERRLFEAKVSDRRREIEEAIKRQNDLFNEELRRYQTRYIERKNALSLKKRTASPANKSVEPTATNNGSGGIDFDRAKDDIEKAKNGK